MQGGEAKDKMITTKSPLADPKVKAATMKAVKAEYGDNTADELFTGTGGQDKEEALDLDIDLVDYKAELNFDKFIKPLLDTDHLKNFDKFDKYLGLDGDSYASFKKGLWYFVHSLQQPTKTYKINYKTIIDNRLNLLAFCPPAGGKTTTKYKIKKLVDNKDCIETSGLCHPQQLIGKIIPATARKEKKEIPGILSYNLVIHDEVQDFLNEKNDLYAASQKLKRQAMDIYGYNTIDKKQVDNAPGETMKCMSPSRFLDFAHKKKLESPFFDTGSFRRYWEFNLATEELVDLDDLTKFELDGNKEYVNYPYILKTECRGNKWEVVFNQPTLDIIAHCHAIILKFLLNHKNENAFRYGMMMKYDLRAKLSKMVYILALVNNEKIPSVKTTIMACRDTILFVLESIKTINEFGNIGTTSDVWYGLDENKAQALIWLFRKGATSLESSDVTINKLWTVLGHLHGCKITQARAHFYKLKREGYVNSKKGKNTSRVWLKFIPKGLKIIEKEEKGIEFFEKLFKSVGAKTPPLTLLKRIFGDFSKGKAKEMYEKAKSDGSVGVLMYVLLCDKAYDIYNIYNIYKRYPPTPTEPTLLVEDKPITDDKPEKQDYQKPKNESAVLEEENIPPEAKSTRDTQYFEAKECESIQKCSKKEVLAYIKDNPNYTIPQLLEKFGPGVMDLKKEGLLK